MLAGKAMPVIGSALSVGSAANRLGNKDYLGAGLDLSSAVISPFAPMVSLPIDLINMGRDLTNKDNSGDQNNTEEDQARINFMKNAESQLQKDLADPKAGLNSDLYQAISPALLSSSDPSIKQQDSQRIQDLHNQVRQGLVGLEYITGLKKNKGETFYDAHPVQATATDLLKKSPLIAGALGLGGVAENYRRQWKNMRKTEQARMSREGNPKVDVTNASELLESDRPDIARIFGTLKDDPEGLQKRLKILDRLSGQSSGEGSLANKLEMYGKSKEEALKSHTAKMDELKSQLGTSSDRGHVERMKALMADQTTQHTKELETVENLKKKLLSEARQNPGSAALEKYVNLQESLRRGNVNGGLSSYIGEGEKYIPGFKDLAEKYHTTGARQFFDPEILSGIAKEHGGGKFNDTQIRQMIQELADPSNQSSGIKKFLSKAKIPITRAAIGGLGGVTLYQLLKMMQNQNYSPQQMNEWKKNLLKSRGDFDAAQELEGAAPQQQLR